MAFLTNLLKIYNVTTADRWKCCLYSWRNEETRWAQMYWPKGSCCLNKPIWRTNRRR